MAVNEGRKPVPSNGHDGEFKEEPNAKEDPAPATTAQLNLGPET
jgi:hypothetical protein